MAKRSADTKTSPKAKVTKTDPKERLEPLFQLVDKAQLGDTSKSMLVSMAPHCVGNPTHEFQVKFKEMLDGVVTKVDMEHVEGVERAQASLTEIQEQLEVAQKAVATETEEVTAARAVRTQKEEALNAARKEVASAHAAVATAKNKVESIETERSAMVAEKAEYESLLEGDWAVLKAGTIDGKKWRERAKLIAFSLKMLEPVGLDAALESALPVAFKTKPSERGSFAEKAIVYAEDLLHKTIAKLAEKLSGFEAEAAGRAQVLVDAVSAQQGACQQEEQRQAEFLAADAAVKEKEASLNHEKKAEKTLAPKLNKSKSALAMAEERLVQVRSLIAEFKQLNEAAAPLEG
ncbi:unnamed protein product [Durusdinium trenchii]|uniref:Uncharacterized protein n=1 Tax=Durusdinium trenchii TaxID=1381693 RepID=A0ABP0PM10_9DINO